MNEFNPRLAPATRRHVLTLGASALLSACAQTPARPTSPSPLAPRPEPLSVP
ncbi:MAG: 2-pyrone-4,6-dicarboxylate hydrolase, partial [Curvibacter sp.]